MADIKKEKISSAEKANLLNKNEKKCSKVNFKFIN